MSRYLVIRLLLAIPTIIAVTVLIFLAMHVLPGDPLVALTSLQGFAKLDPDDRARLMEQLHLSDPTVEAISRLDERHRHPSFGRIFLPG